MKYNIIGDVHCRKNWKSLVDDDATNVFVGDYFSPYERIPFDEQMRVFEEICAYAREHNNVVLLCGNHDEDHWHVREIISRHNHAHCADIARVFENNADLFRMAYAIDNDVLITHAGVSIVWYASRVMKNAPHAYVEAFRIPESQDSAEESIRHYFGDDVKYARGILFEFKRHWYEYDVTTHVATRVDVDDVKTMCEKINALWKNKQYDAFSFRNNVMSGDCYGEDVNHSCQWIRPNALQKSNALLNDNVYQVVGHTQFAGVANYKNLYFVDCLACVTQCLTYDDETKLFSIKKVS